VTFDSGLILVRELDERLGLEKLIEEHVSDTRPMMIAKQSAAPKAPAKK
jgi:hypothetical protein